MLHLRQHPQNEAPKFSEQTTEKLLQNFHSVRFRDIHKTQLDCLDVSCLSQLHHEICLIWPDILFVCMSSCAQHLVIYCPQSVVQRFIYEFMLFCSQALPKRGETFSVAKLLLWIFPQLNETKRQQSSARLVFLPRKGFSREKKWNCHYANCSFIEASLVF